MSNNTHILDYFPSYIFWDVKAKELDINAHSQYIIEKAMMACADQNEFNIAIQKLEKLYSKKHIKDVIFCSKEFLANSLYFAKIRYNHSNTMVLENA